MVSDLWKTRPPSRIRERDNWLVNLYFCSGQVAIRFRGNSLARPCISQFSLSILQSVFCVRILFSRCRSPRESVHCSWFTSLPPESSAGSGAMEEDFKVGWITWTSSFSGAGGAGGFSVLLFSNQASFLSLDFRTLLPQGLVICRWPGPKGHFHQNRGHSSVTVQVQTASPSFLPKLLAEFIY